MPVVSPARAPGARLRSPASTTVASVTGFEAGIEGTRDRPVDGAPLDELLLPEILGGVHCTVCCERGCGRRGARSGGLPTAWTRESTSAESSSSEPCQPWCSPRCTAASSCPSEVRRSSCPMNRSPGRWKPSSAAIHGSDRTRTTIGDDDAHGVARESRLERARRRAGPLRQSSPSARATPTPGMRFCQRAFRCDWLTNRGIVAQSASDGPAINQARRGRSLIETRTSTIATSANGQFVCTAARLSPRLRPSALHVVELGGVDPRST